MIGTINPSTMYGSGLSSKLQDLRTLQRAQTDAATQPTAPSAAVATPRTNWTPWIIGAFLFGGGMYLLFRD